MPIRNATKLGAAIPRLAAMRRSIKGASTTDSMRTHSAATASAAPRPSTVCGEVQPHDGARETDRSNSTSHVDRATAGASRTGSEARRTDSGT